MWKSFEDKKRKPLSVKVVTMVEHVNRTIERVILARKDVPPYVDMSTITHAGTKQLVW